MPDNDDETPTPLERPSRGGPLPGPRPSPPGPRDTQPPRPAASPAVPAPNPNEAPTNPRIMLERVYAEAKRNKKRHPINVAAAISAIAAALGGAGYGVHRADQADVSGQERQIKTEQKLDDHLQREAEHHADVTKRLDMQDRASRRQERSQATIKAMLDLELDTHHVPRSRRPADDEPEPSGPPGERP